MAYLYIGDCFVSNHPADGIYCICKVVSKSEKKIGIQYYGFLQRYYYVDDEHIKTEYKKIHCSETVIQIDKWQAYKRAYLISPEFFKNTKIMIEGIFKELKDEAQKDFILRDGSCPIGRKRYLYVTDSSIKISKDLFRDDFYADYRNGPKFEALLDYKFSLLSFQMSMLKLDKYEAHKDIPLKEKIKNFFALFIAWWNADNVEQLFGTY